MSVPISHFDYVRDLVKRECGIAMERDKEYLIENRLSKIAREQGFQSTLCLVAALQHRDCQRDLTDSAVDALTINETSFFRDKRPFHSIENIILPQIIENNRVTKRISIWSGAASTGQEIYSLAILLRENFSHLSNWSFDLLATDISKRVLQRAQDGIYSDFEIGRGLESKYREKYFEQVSENDWQAKPTLRSMVRFERRNLIESWSNLGKFDLILLRNVLIYFELPQKKAILNRLKNHLNPGGHLLLGSSETTYNIDSDWFSDSSLATSSYQLRSHPTTRVIGL